MTMMLLYVYSMRERRISGRQDLYVQLTYRMYTAPIAGRKAAVRCVLYSSRDENVACLLSIEKHRHLFGNSFIGFHSFSKKASDYFLRSTIMNKSNSGGRGRGGGRSNIRGGSGNVATRPNSCGRGRSGSHRPTQNTPPAAFLNTASNGRSSSAPGSRNASRTSTPIKVAGEKGAEAHTVSEDSRIRLTQMLLRLRDSSNPEDKLELTSELSNTERKFLVSVL